MRDQDVFFKMQCPSCLMIIPFECHLDKTRTHGSTINHFAGIISYTGYSYYYCTILLLFLETILAMLLKFIMD